MTAYLLALTVLAVYMVGVSLMTSQVSYPLYAAVPSGSFVEYHRRYNSRIPLVIIVPGFVSLPGVRRPAAGRRRSTSPCGRPAAGRRSAA